MTLTDAEINAAEATRHRHEYFGDERSPLMLRDLFSQAREANRLRELNAQLAHRLAAASEALARAAEKRPAPACGFCRTYPCCCAEDEPPMTDPFTAALAVRRDRLLALGWKHQLHYGRELYVSPASVIHSEAEAFRWLLDQPAPPAENRENPPQDAPAVEKASEEATE